MDLSGADLPINMKPKCVNEPPERYLESSIVPFGLVRIIFVALLQTVIFQMQRGSDLNQGR